MASSYIQNIHVYNLDRNFFTSSVDTFRRLVGGTYNIHAPDDDHGRLLEDYTGLDVHEFKIRTYDAGTFNDVDAFEIDDTGMSHTKIKYIQGGYSTKFPLHSNTGPILRRKIPVRIIGDNVAISNSDEWRAIVMGGTYGNTQYEQIYSDGVFDNFGFTYDTYYYQLQKNKIDFAAEEAGAATPDLNFYDIGYKYGTYLRRYQNHTLFENIDEKLLPNIYFNEMYKLSIDSDETEFASGMRPQFESFVSREGVVDFSRDPHASKDVQLTKSPPPYILGIKLGATDRTTEGEHKDRALFLREYLTGAYIKNDLSDQTKDYMTEKTKTLYFTRGALDSIIAQFSDISADDRRIDRYPAYAKIRFPIHPTSEGYDPDGMSTHDSITKIISDNNLQEEIMSYLKGTYIGGAMGGTTQKLEFFNRSIAYKTNPSLSSINQVTQSFEHSLNSIDYYQMLIDIAQNSSTTEQSGEFTITSNNEEVMYSMNQNSAFRYEKSKNAIIALNQTIDDENIRFDDKYADSEDTNFVDITNRMFDDTLTNKPEVIAYRIEKVGGPPVGESVTERRKIQDIFIFNDYEDGASVDNYLTYYDTQVKYGEEYTYSIYAYMVVSGLKYKYSNLRMGRLIGNTSIIGDEDSIDLLTAGFSPERYCVQFTDPVTNQPAEQLLDDTTNILGSAETSVVYPVSIGSEIVIAGSYTKYDQAFLDWVWVTTGHNPLDSGTETASALAALNTMFGADYGTIDEFSGDTLKKVHRDWAKLNETWTIVNDWSGDSSYFGSVKSVGTRIRLVDTDLVSEFVTNSTIKSANKYLADFHFELEPSLKIVQVPLTTHTFKVLDHPPVACDVSPYQRKDNSNIIGFYINQESPPLNSRSQKKFQDPGSKFGLYPTPISAIEEQHKADYLSSNSMLERQMIYDYSISPITTVNVYRIDYKPQTLKDFNNNLVFQKQLGVDYNYDYNYTNCFYEEAVKTNKKYYYLFKFINANGVTGYVSPIQVAELVDDGGYKYALFDTMFETDLVEYNPKQISIDFKKLIEITPNPRHTEIQRGNIQRSDDAHELIVGDQVQVGSASELIWGKKFKFRITSKKTGKKIDLNVKYNLGN